MADINSIKLDIPGWLLQQQTPQKIVWQNDIPDGLSVNFFAIPPDIPCALSETERLHDFYSTMTAKSGARIVELSTVVVQGLNAIRFILKVPQPESGLTYLGSLTLPFKNCSYVIKVQCPEYGDTGMREALVGDRILGEFIQNYGDVSKEDIPKLAKEVAARADEPRYDAQFPGHPLSRLRRYLADIDQNVQVAPALHQLPEFIG